MPKRSKRSHERVKELIKECMRCECRHCSACRARLAEIFEIVG